MIAYASRTGTRRNLDALRRASWRLLVSRSGVWRTEGFPYALDNGAWSDFCAGRAFDGESFAALVDCLGGEADWIVAPDVVAGGRASLALSLQWLPMLRNRARLVLVPAQDGLDPADLVSIVGPRVGVFLGGSTEWKLANVARWGGFCADVGCHYHVGRVNTARRIRLAAAAGAVSIDGSSASRFAVTVAPLDAARPQPDLFAANRSRLWKAAE